MEVRQMRKALIVGLNNYGNQNLNWCNHDAIAVSELLKINGDNSLNFDVKTIIGACAKNELSTAIKLLFSDDDDIALLYFSGHGSDKDGGYLVTSDYTESCYGVKMSDVLQWANDSRSRNKVIILDCCFAAKMGEAILENNKTLLGDGVTIIAASQRWQPSAENSIVQHGIFTDLLLQGLQGGAADINGSITPAGLYAYVDQSLGSWQQRPVFKTNISQFLALRTIQAKVPKTVLRKIAEYFDSPLGMYKLDSSYEFTNSPDIVHEIKEPYAIEKNTIIFKDLQLLESVGLIEPVGTEHMYFAAMENKSCRLTPLGKHYWRLANDGRF